MRDPEGTTVSTSVRRLTLAAASLAMCAAIVWASPAFAAVYDPLDVIPYDTWRAAGSMSAADIQSFLDVQSGPLKSFKTGVYHDPGTLDSLGPTSHPTVKTAAQIIWEAARAWNLNPKIVLATLQKEQSLITLSNSANAARLYKAMGCGVYGATDPNTGLTTNRSPGFGHQIWDGARVLSTYEVTYHWTPLSTKDVTAYKSVDATKLVDGAVVSYHKTVSYTKTIRPVNASTFALYTYTPYYPQSLVWDIYVRYFGDPHAAARLLPVYSFRNRTTLAYYYTSSEGQRYAMLSTHGWIYIGAAFTIDASTTANLVPLYRLRNNATGYYAYTVYPTTRDGLLAKRSWVLSGTVGLVSKVASAGAISIYKLENKRSHKVLFTQYASTVTRLTKGRTATFWNRGIGFYLGRSVETTTPVGP